MNRFLDFGILENLLGGGKGQRGKKGDDPGLLGEAREAIVAGCFGLLMSIVFFFGAFFFVIMWLGGGVEGLEFRVKGVAAPLMLLLCVSGFISPLFGVLFGARGGKYHFTQHMGCFFVYAGLIIAGILGLSLAFA